MITKIFSGPNDLLTAQKIPEQKLLWVDMFRPTSEERKKLEKNTGIVLPLHHEMHQIEFSNRFYQENKALYLTVHIVTKAAPVPETHIMTFILSKELLITLRYSKPNPVDRFILDLDSRKFYAKNSFDIFLLIISRIVGAVADIFELIEEKSEGISLFLLAGAQFSKKSNQNRNLNKTLLDINFLQLLLGKSYLSLSSLRLLISFFDETQHQLFTKEDYQRFETVDKDIETLSKHSDHLSQKFNFQLQSTLGLINIEQTQIIKIFTVLAMVFMPPTLIASIYGMNFHNLPELSFKYGYFLVLGLMIMTALGPYLFFKKRGWI